MDSTTATPATILSDNDVQACVRVLRAIESDRSHLTRLTQAQRRELLTLAGLVSKPDRQDLVRMAKAFRRAERRAVKSHDGKLIEQNGPAHPAPRDIIDGAARIVDPIFAGERSGAHRWGQFLKDYKPAPW